MSAVNAGDNLTFTNGVLTVVAQSTVGAKLENDIAYPPGEFDGPMFPMINAKDNPIAEAAGNCSTDDTNALQRLLAWGRDARKATVNVNGAAVTATAGLSFVGLSGVVQINGMIASVKSVSDAQHLTLTAPLPTLNGATLRPGPNVVNLASSGVVTAVSGPSFSTIVTSGPGSQLLVEGVLYQITSVIDSTHLKVTGDGVTSLPDSVNVDAFVTGPGNLAWGRQPLQIYFPAGCYLVHSQLVNLGNYFTLIGDGPQKSYIRLAPNSPSFNAGKKAYLLFNRSNNSNQNFRELISSIGFDIGPGNPNAAAVYWLANNMGSLRNVQIWCEDSNCLQGLGFEGAYSGPSMIRNVAIYGGQVGIQMNGQAEYHATLENITTQGQTLYGIQNGNYHFALRHWLSVNPVSALYTKGNWATGAILDSQIVFSGTGAVAGLNSVSGSLYGRNVNCTGYVPCQIDGAASSQVVRTALPNEFWTGTAQTTSTSGKLPGSLRLPESETPSNPDPCTRSKCTWAELAKDPSTWATTIRNSAASAFYLPPGTYQALTNPVITVPDNVNYINFNAAQFSIATSGTYLTLNVEGSSPTPLIIDGCLYGNCNINHSGSRTVVLNDTNIGYQSVPGAGNVYFDDVDFYPYPKTGPGSGPTFHAGQNIWARDLNIETGTTTDLSYPKFVCDGATMWVLGYKTELDSPSIVGQNGCKAEVFSFFFYQLALNPVPSGTAPIELSNSSLFTNGFIYVNGPGYGPPNFVHTSGGYDQATLPSPSADTPLVLNMFYTDGAK
jgi:hypothetical protein